MRATSCGRHDRNHSKYDVPVATIDAYKFSSFPSVASIWNHLPTQALKTKGTDTLKEVLALYTSQSRGVMQLPSDLQRAWEISLEEHRLYIIIELNKFLP